MHGDDAEALADLPPVGPPPVCAGDVEPAGGGEDVSPRGAVRGRVGRVLRAKVDDGVGRGAVVAVPSREEGRVGFDDC